MDPFTPGQGFDIIKSEDCYVRFQNPDLIRGKVADFGQAIENCTVNTSLLHIATFTLY